MFTGLIEAVGRIASLTRSGRSARLSVDAGELAADVAPGDSVAVSGACLTVVQVDGARLTFDLSAETLERTTLGKLPAGGWVNLERALKAGDRLGGHFVAGHVDGVGSVQSIRPLGDQWTFWFGAARELTSLMIPKGSVAVDGISLTIVGLTEDAFSVAIVPHTFHHTTLGHKRAGDAVNIETDMLAKMVFKALGRLPAQGIDEQFLQERGYC